MRILHVTESYGAGTASAIRQYVASTPEHEHHLAFSERAETPIDDAALLPFASVSRLPQGHVGSIRAIRRLADPKRFDLLHAHSSYGGMYTRIAVSRRRLPLVYTPHCLAFEREDLPRPVSLAILGIENVLAANTTVFAGCSPYETTRTSRFLGARRSRAVYVPNVASGEENPPAEFPDPDAAVRIIGVGRITAQKDPEFFARVIELLRERIPSLRAEWVGDGEPALRSTLESAGTHVHGWLAPSAVRSIFENGPAVYLHTARWEGFPLTVLEASLAGVPAVVRDRPVYAGIDLPLRAQSPESAAADIERILTDASAWHEEITAVRRALAENTSAMQAERLRVAYSEGSRA